MFLGKFTMFGGGRRSFVVFFVFYVLMLSVSGRYGGSYGEISVPSSSKKSALEYQPAGMAIIPAGSHRSGNYGDSYKNSRVNSSSVPIASFYMDIIPITIFQYNSFLDFASKNPNGFPSDVSSIDDEDEEEEEEDDDDSEEEEDGVGEKKKKKSKISQVYFKGSLVSPNREAFAKISMSDESGFLVFLDMYSSDYFVCDAYKSFPMVCVSHKAAELFVEYRTNIMNEYRQKKNLGRLPEFRLPTPQEYSYASKGGAHLPKYSFGGPYPRGNDGRPLVCSKMSRGGYCESGRFGPSPSGEVPSNLYGLKGMSGNVASWTSGKKKTELGQNLYCSMGGGWNMFVCYSEIGVPLFSDGEGDPGIGIRCVMTSPTAV